MNTLLVGVDQDVGDLGVLHQRLERAQAEDLVQHLADQRFPLLEVERDRLLGDEVVDHLADRLDDLLPLELVEVRQVEPLDQPPVDPALDLLEVMLRSPRRPAAAARRRSVRGARPATPDRRSQGSWTRLSGGRSRLAGPGAGPSGFGHGFVASSVPVPRPNSRPKGAAWRSSRADLRRPSASEPGDLRAERLHVLAVLRGRRSARSASRC